MGGLIGKAGGKQEAIFASPLTGLGKSGYSVNPAGPKAFIFRAQQLGTCRSFHDLGLGR